MAERRLMDSGPKTVTVSSGSFEPNQQIPRKHTCQGENSSPHLNVSNLPGDARAFAIVMDDPDAPRGTFTHWLAWNVPADRADLPENVDLSELGADEGKNDFNETGYGGPCPPSGRHRYFVRVYALSERLDLPRGARRPDLEAAMDGKVVAWGELMGTYEKS